MRQMRTKNFGHLKCVTYGRNRELSMTCGNNLIDKIERINKNIFSIYKFD